MSGWDGVPWVAAGGSVSPELARIQSFIACNGGEGVVDFDDCQVLASATPDGSVHVQPGAAAVLARTAGFDHQAYLDRLQAAETLAISPTSAGGGRHDLVVARVEDPALGGWSTPTDPTAGPYMFNRVLPNVAAGTTTVTQLGLGYSAIPLARIDIPASTSAITQAMIVDLRTVIGDTGQQTTTPSWISATSGWSVSAIWWRIKNQHMYLDVNITRTGAQINQLSDPGNIADTVIANITDLNYAPRTDKFTAYRGSLTSGSCSISSTGAITIFDINTNAYIRTNDTVRASFAYPLR